MKSITAAGVLLLSFLALCPYVLGANVVHIPISGSNPDLNILMRGLNGNVITRATVISDLSNNMTGGSGYLVDVNVGTPEQALSLIIDTGAVIPSFWRRSMVNNIISQLGAVDDPDYSNFRGLRLAYNTSKLLPRLRIRRQQ
jgi:hypothetical protein